MEKLPECEFQVMHQLDRQHWNALSRKPCRQCGQETRGEVAAGTEVAEPIITDYEPGQRDSLGKAKDENPDRGLRKAGWFLS